MVNKPFWHISDFFWRDILLIAWEYLILCKIIVICGVLIFFFHSKKTANQVYWKLQEVYGDAALSETTCGGSFHRFKDGDFDVDDRPREGRPKTFEDADVIYYELLKPNETITGERCRTQLMRLSQALREKWPEYEQRQEKMILQQYNARPHVAKPVKTYLETLKWEVIPHLPYSLDIAPSDYYLFRLMEYGLADQQKVYLTIGNTLNDLFVTIFSQFT